MPYWSGFEGVKIKKSVSVFIFIEALAVLKCNAECRYREMDLPREAFSFWASWGCYTFTRPDFFYEGPLQIDNCALYIENGIHYVPGLTNGLDCHPFHHTNKYIVAKVDNSFRSNRSVSRWVECTEEAEECCSNVMAGDTTDDKHCLSVWDGWSCFRSIPAGQNYKMLCTRFAYGNEPPRCHHYSYKTCYANGTWNQQTDYSPCDVTPPLITRNWYFIVTLSISTMFCIPALLVLFFTQAAQSQKLQIIRALLLAICIHNFMVILVRALIIIPELTATRPTTTVMYRNTPGCRALTFLEKLTGNTVFSCMLLVGIFLYQHLTKVVQIRTRANGISMFPYYLGAATVACASATVWAVLMGNYFDHNCWQVTDEGHVDWSLDGPRLIMLGINLILLLRITVSLWHAFNAKDSDENPLLRTLKAALICVPVFGMPFLFLIIRPDMDNCGTEQFYYFVNYTIVGAQGIFIAIFHCYKEREVNRHILGCWRWVKGLFCQEDEVSMRRPVAGGRRRVVAEHLSMTPSTRTERQCESNLTQI